MQNFNPFTPGGLTNLLIVDRFSRRNDNGDGDGCAGCGCMTAVVLAILLMLTLWLV